MKGWSSLVLVCVPDILRGLDAGTCALTSNRSLDGCTIVSFGGLVGTFAGNGSLDTAVSFEGLDCVLTGGGSLRSLYGCTAGFF